MHRNNALKCPNESETKNSPTIPFRIIQYYFELDIDFGCNIDEDVFI